MATWTLREEGVDTFDVLRDGRGVAYDLSYDEALRRVRRDRRYLDTDKVVLTDGDGARTTVKMPKRLSR